MICFKEETLCRYKTVIFFLSPVFGKYLLRLLMDRSLSYKSQKQCRKKRKLISLHPYIDCKSKTLQYYSFKFFFELLDVNVKPYLKR